SFNYSVDNGHSYSSPVRIPNSPVYSTLALGPNGELYIAGVWGDGNLDDLYLLKTQNPLSVMFPNFSQVTPLDLDGFMAIGGVNPLGLLGQMWVAVDKSNRHTRGRVYVFSSINAFGYDPLDVQFIVSHDEGQSFSAPKRINDDGDISNWQWFGTMGVAPNGRIDLIWLDTRNDMGSGYKILSQLFYSYSYDGGHSFSANQPISAPFYHNLGYPVQRKMGDYIDIVSDNQGAHIAYTATFTGGQDVYYLRVKPAAYEENPYFPGHHLDSIWHHPQVPRQGLFSRTLVANPDEAEPQLIQYEAVFTETPTGQPTWFVLEAAQPKEDDQVVFPILYPTGDLSSHSAALSIIGLATKSRVYDAQGELVPNRMKYVFDMTEERFAEVAELAGETDYFDPDFYRNNPFYTQLKSITLHQLVASQQPREAACELQGLPLLNSEEIAEGRVSVVYNRDNKNAQFAGDFGYQKVLDEANQLQIVLDDNGLAIPEWYVMETTEGDVVNDSSTTNVRYKTQGGNGFFVANAPDPGLIDGGIEQVTRINASQIETTRDNGVREILSVLAYGSYCGRDLTTN
ncbi:MAG: exo-alpha-sialidase, partial [Proteobacteria bacterium]